MRPVLQSALRRLRRALRRSLRAPRRPLRRDGRALLRDAREIDGLHRSRGGGARGARRGVRRARVGARRRRLRVHERRAVVVAKFLEGREGGGGLVGGVRPCVRDGQPADFGALVDLALLVQLLHLVRRERAVHRVDGDVAIDGALLARRALLEEEVVLLALALVAGRVHPRRLVELEVGRRVLRRQARALDRGRLPVGSNRDGGSRRRRDWRRATHAGDGRRPTRGAPTATASCRRTRARAAKTPRCGGLTRPPPRCPTARGRTAAGSRRRRTLRRRLPCRGRGAVGADGAAGCSCDSRWSPWTSHVMPTALFLWPALAPPSTTTSVSSTVLWFGLLCWCGGGLATATPAAARCSCRAATDFSARASARCSTARRTPSRAAPSSRSTGRSRGRCRGSHRRGGGDDDGSIVIVLEVGGGHYAGTARVEMAWAAKYEGQTAPNCGDGTPTPDAAMSARETRRFLRRPQRCPPRRRRRRRSCRRHRGLGLRHSLEKKPRPQLIRRCHEDHGEANQ